MGLSTISLSLASTPSHILAVVLFKGSVEGGCGACVAAYLTLAMVLLPAPVGASGGT
jgi:multisubunit Na+/H+ antiporter MnhG subunit